MACAIGLIATSSWLISRSAQRPAESALALAIVAALAGVLRGRSAVIVAHRPGMLELCDRVVDLEREQVAA